MAEIAPPTYRKQARMYRVIYTLLTTDPVVYDNHRISVRGIVERFVKLNVNLCL